MSPFFALFLVLLLASSSYAAGRLHAQLSYRIGYRFGYRQGYFDGDRGAWNRRRREAQAAIASVLAVPTLPTPVGPPSVVAAAPVTPVGGGLPPAGATMRVGTTYTGSASVAAVRADPRPTPDVLAGRHA